MKAHRLGLGLLMCLLVGFGLENCSEKKEEATNICSRTAGVQGVGAAESRVRRFPSILQPADVSVLSFEIAGQLKAVNLQAGQKVQLGDVLAEIDPRSLQTQVEQASAGVQQAQAQFENAEADFQRKQELLKKGVTTQAAFDQSKATLAHRKGATRSSTSSARAGKSQPRSQQAARSFHGHHRPRRSEIVRAGCGRATDRDVVQ